MLLPSFASADPNRIDWYTCSDTNVLDFWTNFVKPQFEAANPGITLNLVDGGDGAGHMRSPSARSPRCKAKADPQADIFEDYDPRLPEGAIEAGLWTDFSKAGLSNYRQVNPLTIDIDYSLPYRGSQVLLGYDTTKLKPADAPKTLEALVAWIKANPGQFIYNRPDKGGSGSNFVQRAVYQANGKTPTPSRSTTSARRRPRRCSTRPGSSSRTSRPRTFGQGAYTSGNTQSVQLLGQTAVTMIPAWSDQALPAIEQGVLPETTGLVQLDDLALSGGFRAAWWSSPTASTRTRR